MKHPALVLILFLAWLAMPAAALAAPTAALELPLLFSDGAVLQRDRPLPVWGQAAPGAQVRVEFDGSQAQATAGDDGRWSLQLPAHAAGGPYALTVRAGDEERRIDDVLVGEVWLASGQSNMEWPVAQSLHAQEDIAGAGDARLRHFKVPKSWAEAPRAQLEGGQWQAAAPGTVGEFSAIGYAFARELRQVLGVPVGIIDSTWGGSSIEAWMDAAMLGLDAATLEEKMRQRRAADARVEAQVRERVAAWPEADPASEAFAAAELDDSGWAAIKVPSAWEAEGYAGMDGVAWYRTAFELSAAEAAAGIVLGLGQIDDSDTAWVNGRRVGGVSNGWNVPRVYPVPASALRAGGNVLAVRVQDDGGGGGIVGSAQQVYLQTAGGERRALAGPWRFRTAQVRVSLADDKNQVDTLLYNAMIHPLLPYPLAGAIWYQGETNASEQGAHRYRDQFKTMIQGWRAAWRQPGMPFLWVQLAPFGSGGDRVRGDGTVVDSPWATLRESQSAALALPATAQAVITDVGDVHDIHPRDKRTVGHRLALAAQHVAYGQDGFAWRGPAFREAAVDGRVLVLHFDAHDGVLAVRGGGDAPRGFELAGANGRFHPARARIAGDTVVLESPKVRKPAMARYGWSDAPAQADLVGADGLPASPFRTHP
ncbi:9-O-acetylesterase [Pseudoxanthomonas broegbernensis]|uniref:9-O-acetylesterase n=1 Tax=Pseudoxanthomonas broegbernensis TaxID=83619 RepID=A0A7V8GK06_9GAMM|nr:sialate O-acetylesterase [Pseudoxanthomonas broegbernensis]KAF1684628.1 9-O-acetylesterase [Pseudoxanthomonas broegbernensis]MBB6064161.1 sialate O-acetylesterase [Pseudoxanthomonas broegbernensis]